MNFKERLTKVFTRSSKEDNEVAVRTNDETPASLAGCDKVQLFNYTDSRSSSRRSRRSKPTSYSAISYFTGVTYACIKKRSRAISRLNWEVIINGLSLIHISEPTRPY